MWVVSKHNKWNPLQSSLEKFLAERIIQRCDYTEIISNKHRSTNGYTQLKELVQLCFLTTRRSRTVKTLIKILEEAKSRDIKQNIVSDAIIENYFVELRKYISNYDAQKLLSDGNQPNLLNLSKLSHDLKLFEVQLDRHYFEVLKKELLSLDYKGEERFDTRANYLSTLIDLLIPYLLYRGYSVASIRGILILWIIQRYHITASRILDFFHFQKRTFYFVQYLGEKSDDLNRFLQTMKESVGSTFTETTASNLGSQFLAGSGLAPQATVVSYSQVVLDPHNHVRSNYDFLLKRLVLKRERASLAIFENFFSQSFWSNNNHFNTRKPNIISLDDDPINVNSRGKTFRSTLVRCAEIFNYRFDDQTDIPTPESELLRNSIYYYNLALGSKSIENSLSLLWTALESMIPYRLFGSDIECVQHVVSKGLSLGGLARDVSGFAVRFIHLNRNNDDILNGLGTRGFKNINDPQGLEEWFEWIADPGAAPNRFEVVKKCSELLAYQYSKLGRNYSGGQLSSVLDRIEASRASMVFQLQKIYLHRNQIVHSGDIVNEYTNLWMHLEWYVGKLLAYFFIQIHFMKRRDSFEATFRDLEASHDYLVDYLKMNRKKGIKDCPRRIKKLLFEHSWQSF